MNKHFLPILSKMKFLIPLYLIIFHCSLPVDPAEFAPQNLSYDKKTYFLYSGEELKAVASVEYTVDSFTIDPKLPPGLNLDKSTGTISGKSDSVLPLTTFTVQAFNKNGSTARILTIEISQLPSFVVQPQNVSAKLNDSVTFTAQATGKSPLKYSWTKNNVAIDGKNSSTLILPAISFSDTGSYRCKVVDSTGKTESSDPARCQIIDTGVVTKTDTVPPVITRVKPERDSVSTNSTSYTIKITCTDSSGVASVKGSLGLGSQSFTGTRGTGNDWIIAISGLVENKVNKIVITAIDSSSKLNLSTKDYYIKCDPTMVDNEPPTVYFANPLKDTVISVDSFTVTAICKDPSGITSLTGLSNSTPFVMTKSATVDSLWTGTVKGLQSGVYTTVKLIATDASTANNRDSISVRIKYDGDIAGPVMTKVTPAKDSVSTNATSYTISITCTDSSGVTSVKGLFGSQSFTGTRGAGATWTIPISGLTANVYNTIIITATDSSLKANPSTLKFYIKCDPTMLDSIGPTIIQKSGPISSAIVTNAVIDIVDSISDPSGIENIYWTRNGGTKKTMSPVLGNDGLYSLKDTLTEGKFDTLQITAVDKSTRGNPSTQTIILKFIKALTITTQPVSKTVCLKAQAIFSVVATGTAPSYQWRAGAINPANITGATSSSYTPGTATAGQTVLSCVISNGSGIDVVSSLCTLTVRSSSSAPASISGPASICSGQPLTLSVSGGTLGTGATWRWYSNSTFTTIAGTGSSITLTPTDAATYYVRAEGPCDTTTAVSKAISINSLSTAATSVNTTATSVCSGGPVTLSVVGGILGAGASWNWYTNPECTQTATGTPNATGSTFQATPTKATTFYVRAEGPCDTTLAVSRAISMNSPSADPTGIIATLTEVCPNQTTTLTVQGGSLGTGATWKWYTNPSLTTSVGSGVSITPTVTATTTYYVRAEGGCTGNTATVSKIISTYAPITFQTNPASQSICNTYSTYFSVVVNGGGTGYLNYHWNLDGIPISNGANYSGATTSFLTVQHATNATIGNYTCTVDNGAGCSVVSTAGTLSITPSPITITTQPQGEEIQPGSFGGVSVYVSGGSGSYTYQWYHNNSPIDAKGFMYYVYGCADMAGDYYCVIGDESNPNTCPITSNHVTISSSGPCQ